MDKKIFQKVSFADQAQELLDDQILSFNEILSCLEENRNLFTIYKVTNPELHQQLHIEEEDLQNYDPFIQIQQ